MRHHSVYQWRIDWDDDGYDHPLAEIPDQFVIDYRLGWGSTLYPGAPEAGVAIEVGHLILHNAGGIYYRPTTGGLTADQLDSPHDWDLHIDGVFQAKGRAEPVLGIAMGSLSQPVTWQLKLANEPQLRSAADVTNVSGSSTAVLSALSDHTGLSVFSSGVLPLRGVANFVGNTATLVNMMATLVGGWALSLGSGAVRIATPADILSGDATTIDERHGISRDRSGVGKAHSLVRTRWHYPGFGTAVGQPSLGANEARYGQRLVRIPQGWFTIYDLPYVVGALRRHARPPTLVQFELGDIYDTEALSVVAVGATLPGQLCAVQLPDLEDQPADYRTLIMRTELSGGFGRGPRRLCRGLSVAVDGGTAPPSDEFVSTAPPAILLSLHTPSTVRITWFDDGRGAVDIQRTQTGWTQADMIDAVTSGATLPHYDDMPGNGYWQYRLVRGSSVGPPAGPILVGAAEYPGEPDPAPVAGTWWRAALPAQLRATALADNPAGALNLVGSPPNYRTVRGFSTGSNVIRSISYDDPAQSASARPFNGVGFERFFNVINLMLWTTPANAFNFDNSYMSIDDHFPYLRAINADGTTAFGIPLTTNAFQRGQLSGGEAAYLRLALGTNSANRGDFGGDRYFESVTHVRFATSVPTPTVPVLVRIDGGTDAVLRWSTTYWGAELFRAPVGEVGASVVRINSYLTSDSHTDADRTTGQWDYWLRVGGPDGNVSPRLTVTIP